MYSQIEQIIRGLDERDKLLIFKKIFTIIGLSRKGKVEEVEEPI